jgi:hypothetical protein
VIRLVIGLVPHFDESDLPRKWISSALLMEVIHLIIGLVPPF